MTFCKLIRTLSSPAGPVRRLDSKFTCPESQEEVGCRYLLHSPTHPPKLSAFQFLTRQPLPGRLQRADMSPTNSSGAFHLEEATC